MFGFLNQPIRRQLFVIVFIVALPTLGALMFTLISERNSARDQAVSDAQKLASSIASEEQGLMTGIQQLLTVLAQLPEIKERNSLKLNPILADVLRLNPQYTNIHVADRTGAVWASGVPLTGPTSQSDKRFFKNAVSSRRFSSGEFTVGNITKKQSFHFALPFLDQYGEVAGVIGCGIDVSSFKKVLDRSKLPDKSNFIVLDHKGIVLTRAINPEKYTGKPDDPYNFGKMSNGPEEGWFYHQSRAFDGVKRYAYYYKLRLKDESEPYMYIRAGVPVNEVMSAASMPIVKSLSVLCLALMAACGLAYVISKKSILQRVENLKFSARQIGLGNFNIKFTDTVTGGELGELAQAFDETVLKLAESERERTEKEFTLREQARLLEHEMAERQKANEQLGARKIQLEHEIEERKTLAIKLEESKQLLAHIIDFLPDATFVVDNEKKVIAWNRAVERLTGVPKSDVLGRGNDAYSRAFHGIQRDILVDLIDENLETLELNYSKFKKNGTILTAESFSPVLNAGNGAYLWSVVAPLFNSEGSRTGTIEIVRDVTELKITELALHEQQERYRLFTSLTSDYVSECERQGTAPFRVKWIGGAVETVTGYTEDEIFSKGCWLSIVHPDDFDRISSYLIHLVPGDISTEEFRLIHETGEVRWVREFCYCRAGAAPGELILYSATTDITKQKSAEEDRLSLERRLLHSQKLESLGVLTGGIAHDFNNLLTAILGNLELGLARVAGDSPVAGNIEKALQASQRAADLTQQMLAYAGKGIFQLASVDLGRLIRENVDFFRTVISKRIELSILTSSDIPMITADPGQIQQVVMNLITNASEAIGENPGTIVVKSGVLDCDEALLGQSLLDEKPSPGRFACIEVSDSGCGMSDESRKRIFEPFYTTKFTGRGLGMSAVLGIIKVHDGAILIESTPGSGSTFTVLFPESHQVFVAPQDQNTHSAAEQSCISRGTVLVVDDEPDVCEICEEYLHLFGFTSLRASDGFEALELFRVHSDEIIFVILDMAMPHMDGVAAFKELKTIRPDIKVIISSGNAAADTRLTFQDMQPDAFIQKPFNIQELKNNIAKLMG